MSEFAQFDNEASNNKFYKTFEIMKRMTKESRNKSTSKSKVVDNQYLIFFSSK